VHDLQTRRVLAALAGHRAPVRRVFFDATPAQKQVISASADGDVRIWEWAGGATPVQVHQGPASGVTLSPDGKIAATLGTEQSGGGSGGRPAVVRFWWLGQVRYRQADAPHVLGGPPTSSVSNALGGLAYLGDGRVVAAAGTWAGVIPGPHATGPAVPLIDLGGGRASACWLAESGKPLPAVERRVGATTQPSGATAPPLGAPEP